MKTNLTVETIRVALLYRGKFLVLQKDVNSKNPSAIEFPGGKIKQTNNKPSLLKDQKNAVITEVEEETKIDVKNLKIEKVEEYEIFFEVIKYNVKKQYKRLVHLFLINIPNREKITVKVNQTKNEKGESEDKHTDFKWISPDELIESCTKLTINQTTGERFYSLSRNSRRIKKLLQIINYSKPKKQNCMENEIRVNLASEDDWQDYKKMRLAAITSKDAKMFGFNLKKEMEMSEEDWRELSRGNKFVVLAWCGTESIGVGFANENAEKNYWWFRSGYVFDEYQRKGIGRRIFKSRLEEVKKRGGKKIRLGLNGCNDRSYNLAQSYGFKKICKWEQLKIYSFRNLISIFFYHIMELDL